MLCLCIFPAWAFDRRVDDHRLADRRAFLGWIAFGDRTSQNSAGFLQSKVAKRIDTRYTPRLVFVLDLGVKRSIEISQILQSVLPKPAAEEDEPEEPPEEADA